MSPLWRWTLWVLAGLALTLVFLAYHRPDFAYAVTNLIWSCF